LATLFESVRLLGCPLVIGADFIIIIIIINEEDLGGIKSMTARTPNKNETKRRGKSRKKQQLSPDAV
jgi:hypothetical protein